MPGIQFDLDAMDLVPDVAQAAGIDQAHVGWGLPRLWRWAWRTKSLTTTTAHIGGFFGGDPERVAIALETFGFLERVEQDLWRIRGAKRYLRITEARSRGGHAARGNLIPGGKRRIGSSSAEAEETAGHTSGLPSALTAISDQRSADQKDLIPKQEQNVIAPGSQIQRLWNEVMSHPPFPRWLALDGERKKAAKARWEENPSEGYWREVMARIARSPWCRGEIAGRDGRKWIADPDFLLRPGTHGKAMEGKYDRRDAPVPVSGSKGTPPGFRLVGAHDDPYRRGGP